MIDWHWVARFQWHQNYGPPWCALACCSLDAFYKGIANVVFYRGANDSSARDEELVFDVDEMLGSLNSIQVGGLNRMFCFVWCADGPRASRAADLHLTSSRKLEGI